MTTTFKLSAKSAKKGDYIGGQSITKTGGYDGKFISVKKIIASTGTIGVEFSFKSENDGTAGFLSIYIQKKDGTLLPDYDTLNAIMACMKVKSITEKQMDIEEYSKTKEKMIKVNRPCYPELMGKPIGMVLQREEYYRTDNSIGATMGIYAAYNVESRQTAIEILDQKKPERLEKILDVVKDKKVAKKTTPKTANAGDLPDGDFDDDAYDDDIPF